MPKSGWQPAPQYVASVPQYPYEEQHFPAAQDSPDAGPQIPLGDRIPLVEGLVDDGIVSVSDDCPPCPPVEPGEGDMLPMLMTVDIEIDDVPPPDPPRLAALTGRAYSSTAGQFGIGIVANTAVIIPPLSYSSASPS